MRMGALRGPDAGTLLVRALRTQAADAGIAAAIRSIASRPWASATFVGMQHRIVLAIEPTAAVDRWIAGLPDTEWSLRGYLVADVVIDRVEGRANETMLSMAILTIEDN